MKNKSIEEFINKKIQIKMFDKKTDFIIFGILIFVVLVCIFSPKIYLVKTARWTNWDEQDTKNVVTAMGNENTEERFRLYFQYYNVIHELGHGLIIYNKGVNIPIAEEEQLVNDFAVAYWRYYGDSKKIDELYDIVTYAVEHVGDNYKNGIDYMENAKKHSDNSHFDDDFFNFNDYGWFQFSCVKHSIEHDMSLEEVLKKMGFKNFKLTEKELLIHDNMSEKESTLIINEAVKKFNEWGLYFPNVHQSFSNNPNMNSSRPFKNIFGIFK